MWAGHAGCQKVKSGRIHSKGIELDELLVYKNKVYEARPVVHHVECPGVLNFLSATSSLEFFYCAAALPRYTHFLTFMHLDGTV